MIADLTALGLETGYVYVYRLQHGARRVEIGKTPPDIDGGFAYVV